MTDLDAAEQQSLSPADAARLRASIEQLDTGDGEVHELIKSDAEIVRAFWAGEQPANWPERLSFPTSLPEGRRLRIVKELNG